MEARLVDSAGPDSIAAPSAQRESSLMQSINRNLRQRTDSLADPDPIAFFCECQSADCYSAVWMSAATFDATRASDDRGWLLADGHEPSVLWEASALVPSPAATSAVGAPAEAPTEQGQPAEDPPSGAPRGAPLEHDPSRPPTAPPSASGAEQGRLSDGRGELAGPRP